MVRRAAPLLVLLLAGCGLLGQRTVAAPPLAPAVVHDAWPGCATLVSDPQPYDRPRHDPGGVPAGFAPARVVLCGVGERVAKNGDLLSVRLERTATDVAPLLTYLGRPGEVAVHPDQITCPAMAVADPTLFLVDADRRWIDVSVPKDACAFPLDTFAEDGPIYFRLAYADRVVRTLGVSETAAVRAAGCTSEWKNVVTVEAVDAAAAVDAAPWPDTEVRRCRYDVPAADRDTDTPGGTFVDGGPLAAETATVVRRELARSTPAQPCGQNAGSFVLLQATDGSEPLVYVELDGCRRVLVEGQPRRVAQATPELIRRLS